MPTYISLLSWTEQGIDDVKQSPQRLDAARRQLREKGGMVKEVFLLMGDYDMLFVSQAPDDETYATFLLTFCSKGGVRTKTMKAFPEDQFRKIIDAL